MINVEKKHDKIFYYKNAISNVDSIIDFIELSDKDNQSIFITKWEEWKSSSDETVYGYAKNAFLGNQKILDNTSLNEFTICNNILVSFYSCIKHYCNSHGIDEPAIDRHFSIKKYFNGADMGDHVDEHNNEEMPEPYLTSILYLNDDYEGGNLLFREQGLDIKPEAGGILIFPSVKPFFHNPRPTTSGTKYMIQIFLYKRDNLQP
jgi:hypothetical protein